MKNGNHKYNGNRNKNFNHKKNSNWNKGNNKKPDPNNPFVKAAKAQREENEIRKQEAIKEQSARFDLLQSAAEYLNIYLTAGSNPDIKRINYMERLIAHLENSGFLESDIRHNMNQMRPLVDLLWARKDCTFMTQDRLNIRIDYILEMYRTMSMRSLHFRIDNIVSSAKELFDRGEDNTTIKENSSNDEVVRIVDEESDNG